MGKYDALADGVAKLADTVAKLDKRADAFEKRRADAASPEIKEMARKANALRREADNLRVKWEKSKDPADKKAFEKARDAADIATEEYQEAK